PADSERMLTNLLGEAGPPGEAERQIVAAAGGNPLFIEEMLRMLVDDGLLVREREAWVVRGDLAHIGAPETVQAVIAARLDRLDPSERAALQRASVVGEVFWWRAVADLSDQCEAVKARLTLHALARKEPIHPGPSTLVGD